ncbi:hypothetical protein C9J48_04165 [Photobacterium profundum]|uniref:Uncharacterized protein n=1 Tax=Photobacterium profundum 3TCK TaxID=314280 RepID=Q1Z7H8_9GAMM|nr:hypothetical protein [Photobacterium profundum]EAS44481.1 hypothetical protein P3TCK_15030 [Photobacterium profundum 3TCK]PSV64655.1 hypothetical protein C9J48_04165 [Photobacterium profundum]
MLARNKRPLTPFEIEQRERTVPLSYIAAYWGEHKKELYEKTYTILDTETKLLALFPDKYAVREREFVNRLLGYTEDSDYSLSIGISRSLPAVYKDVWFNARCAFEWETMAERQCTKSQPTPPQPDLSTGLSPKQY